MAAGAFIAIASYYARRHALLPGWLTIAGYVVAALQLAGTLFIPIALVPLWILVTSIVLLRRSSDGGAGAPVAATG